MQCLVMPNFHSQPCPDTSTKHCLSKKCRLSDAPLGFLCLPLVDSVHEKSDHVDNNEVNQGDMQEIFVVHRLHLPHVTTHTLQLHGCSHQVELVQAVDIDIECLLGARLDALVHQGVIHP